MDRSKPGARAALADLARVGLRVMIITGDARLMAEHIPREVGISEPRVLTGFELDRLEAAALRHAAEQAHLFVQVDHRQKERIISSLR